jgi:poly(3-hydroxybutyrate) depolymerase
MRPLVVVLALLAFATPAHAQVGNCQSLEKLNCRLGGQVLDYTHNHGPDRRIVSPILGRPRDLYVYVPPGYTPARAYPLLMYFHMAYLDEHWIVATDLLVQLDGMILRGEFPPTIVAIPDGMISGENKIREPHSLFVNGVNGRFEDHILYELLPFLSGNFSIRPESQAHALMGCSGGGFGAMSIALRHRELFGAVATLAAPLNLRYWNCQEDYQADFDPATFRWHEVYDPDMVIATFYFGLRRTRARTYVEPVFGSGPEVLPRVIEVNPAELLFRPGLPPGELAIYVNYPGKDNYNFDAQDESFAWIAGQNGVALTLECDPCARHSLAYFRANHIRAYRWLACHMPPPLELGAPR